MVRACAAFGLGLSVAVGLMPVVAAEAANRDHWAFQPVVRPVPPTVANSASVRNPIDRFILARLDAEGIAPSAPANRTTLIRRLSFDLRGLPPTLAEIDRFLADEGPNAYDRLVERMLAEPQYGERWGRHWLDLARYADSNGFTRDFARQIWRYRDWVIDAVNRDLSFDQFTLEQLAGDLLPDAILDQRIATGFHRNTLINEEGGTDAEQFRVDAVADRVATTGSVFLGLTLNCARCHDHKFDPISQREYYEFFAFLNNCDEPTIDAPTLNQITRGDLERRAAVQQKITAVERELADQRDALLEQQFVWEKSITPEQRTRLPGPVQEALMAAPDKRTKAQGGLLARRYKRTDAARKAFPLVDEIARLRASAPKIPTTMVLHKRKAPRESHVHKRGNFLDHGERVFPGVPAMLNPLRSTSQDLDRLDLAAWIVDPANPLTARVIVNRFWQRFFGRGLVETENDFGTQGSLPSHPELLDWLASELIARRWSVKAIHRLIVTSATYRQASRFRADLATVDPDNRRLARQSRMRLEAEIIRDAALAVSGLLTEHLGGPGVFPPQPPGVFEFTQDPKPWNTATDADRYRRGMYTHFWRSSPYPALTVFDFPNSNVTCTRRVRSNTPLQALTLANDITFIECARQLAARVLDTATDDDMSRIRRVFRLCLGRLPGPEETRRVAELVDRQRAAFERDPQAAAGSIGAESSNEGATVERATWTAVARVLLNLDEFITRE